MGDIIVRMVTLPLKVKAFTIPDNGDYVILINASLNQEQQVIAYEHEINHIMNDDFNEDPDMIEIIRH